MAARSPVRPPEQDPTTVIGLIYRIVDEPRRALTLVSVLLPVLAVIIQVSAARTTVAKIPTPVIWWTGTALWEICWWTCLTLVRRKSGKMHRPAASVRQVLR
jgi:hypothetical protein